MPREIDDATRRNIVYYRAIDYDKQEIADKVGVSRNTVRKHLQEIRDEVEQSDASRVRLATIVADESEILTYIQEQSEHTFVQLRNLLEGLSDPSSDKDE